jgi:hypothetical protein
MRRRIGDAAASLPAPLDQGGARTAMAHQVDSLQRAGEPRADIGDMLDAPRTALIRRDA